MSRRNPTLEFGSSSVPEWAGSNALIFARSQTVAIASPRPDPIVRFDLRSRKERVLLWAPFLFPRRRTSAETTKIRLLGEDRLLFDSFRELQTITEFASSDATRSALVEDLSVDRQPAYSPGGSRNRWLPDGKWRGYSWPTRNPNCSADGVFGSDNVVPFDIHWTPERKSICIRTRNRSAVYGPASPAPPSVAA